MNTHDLATAVENVVDNRMAAVPPVVVSGVSILGIELQQWAYITTIIYTGLLTIGLIWKWVRAIHRTWRERDEADS